MCYIMPYSTIFKHKKYLDLSSYSAISYVTLVLSCLSIFYTIPPSSALAWKIPWTEELGGLQSMGLLGVGHD